MKYKFIFVICLLPLLIVGCTQNEELTNVDDFLFTYQEVLNTLTNNDMELKEVNNLSIENFKLYYSNPNILTMENNELLLVYIFSDFKGREIAEEELFIRREQILELFDNDILSYKTFEAKNALLVYTISEDTKFESDLINKLDSIVFEKLNEGETIIYTGSSEYWEGEMLVEFYSHWWEDENGNFIDYDIKKIETGKLHYKGNVEDITTSIDYVVEDSTGSARASEFNLSKDGYINLGTSGGSGPSPKKDTIYTVTINWNDKVETFELHAK
ncbi:MAG: hypothetical protein AB7V16_13970 [Vulcanibacillus sp.]